MSVRMVEEHEAGSLTGVYQEIRSLLGLGFVPNVFKAMAALNIDVLLQNWTAWRETLLGGESPRWLKEMVGLVVSRENGSHYSLPLHRQSLALLGIAPEVIDRLAATGDAETLSAPVRRVLSLARAYNRAASLASVDDLEAAGLTEEEVHEVIDTVLIVTGVNRFAEESSVPLDVR